MAVSLNAAWIDAGTDETPKYSGEDYRAVTSLMFKAGPRPLTAAAGIIQGMNVSVSGTTVNVSPGACIVTSDQLGSFVCTLSSQGRLPVTPAHATYTRKDLVIVRVNPTGTSRGGVLDIVKGDAAATANAPTAPIHSLVLAELTIPPRGVISLVRRAGSTGPAGTVDRTPISIAGGADSASGGYVGDNRSGVVTVVVRTSGRSRTIAAGVPRALEGAGLLLDRNSNLWPARVTNGQVILLADAPRGVNIHGSIAVGRP